MSESVQRWRLVFARDDEARFLSHLDAIKLWERAFRRGDIPVATSEGFSPRPRLIFAAPLPLGMLAEHELADLFLAERLTAPDLRARLVAGMPRGYRVVELHNEWVGAPPLAPQLVAADYRMTLLGVERAVVEEGARALLAAERLPREKRRENRTVAYDLRPLLMELRVGEVQAVIGAAPAAPAAQAAQAAQAAAAAPAVGLWVRLRHSQDEGSGRAEEVVAALADVLPGSSSARAAADRPAIEIVHPIRERLWLADELAG